MVRPKHPPKTPWYGARGFFRDLRDLGVFIPKFLIRLLLILFLPFTMFLTHWREKGGEPKGAKTHANWVEGLTESEKAPGCLLGLWGFLWALAILGLSGWGLYYLLSLLWV